MQRAQELTAAIGSFLQLKVSLMDISVASIFFFFFFFFYLFFERKFYIFSEGDSV